MDEVITNAQGTFIKGRQIIDGIPIENECVDSRRKDGRPGIVCKVDIEKAYDRVDWNFLKWDLTKQGFSGRWIGWIMVYIEHPHYSIMLTCITKSFFGSSKGLC